MTKETRDEYAQRHHDQAMDLVARARRAQEAVNSILRKEDSEHVTSHVSGIQLIGIGGRMHSLEEALAIVDAFVATPWSGEERHQRRIDILSEYEKTGQAPEVPGAPS